VERTKAHLPRSAAGRRAVHAAALAAAMLMGPAVFRSSAAQPLKLWIEAEDYVEQRGSQAAKFAMAGASGGFVVDNDWGGRATDYLRYRVALPADVSKLHLGLWHARAMSGDSVLRLVLDGDRKRQVEVRLPPTGGWGFQAEQWRLARAELPGATRGIHTLEIQSTRAANNVNLDGLYLADSPGSMFGKAPPPEMDFPALRAAVCYLTETYGSKYPCGKEFLSRLEALQRERSTAVADAFAVLQRESLVENHPLLAFDKLLFTRRHPLGGQHYAYTEALSWNKDLPRSWRPGSSLCVLSPVRPNGNVTVLVDSPEGVIRDPDVSWDGSKVLFAHKKTLDEDDFHLYEFDMPSRRVAQLTRSPGFADYEGCYLPNGQIVFNSTRCVQSVDCFPTPVSNLYVMDADGGNIHRVSVNHVHDNFPTVLGDGRVVFTRWEYNDRWVIHVQGLAVMNPDGSGTRALYGNNSFWPISMLHARAIPGTGKIVCTLSGHHDVDQYGEIGVFDPARGCEEADGCERLWPKRAIRPIQDEFYWRGLKEHYQYPYPLSDRFFLVSCRPQGKRHFGIYLIDTFGNRVLLYEEADISCNSPMPLAPRARRPVVPSKLDYRRREATVYMANVYRGGGLAGVKPGEVKSLRVVEMLNRPAGTRHWAGMDGSPPMGLCSSWDAKRLLGTVPVGENGSALFVVPAGTAVYFQPLDAKGRALQWMRSWITAQPGETVSCVGCHDPKHSAPPPGTRPIPLRRPDRPKSRLNSRDAFSFHADVQPVLDRACVRCHHQDHPKGIDLRGDKTDAFSLGYEHLRRYVRVPGTRQDPPTIPAKAQGAIASPLVQMLEKGHNDVRLTAEEFERLVTWIDLNAPYYGSYAITRYDANFGRCVVQDARPLWQALGQRCFECHKTRSVPPNLPEEGFSRFGKHEGRDFHWSTKDRYDTGNALLINLTHPEQSRLLRAPLAKESGGLGLHKENSFKTAGDPAYQAALKVLQGWAAQLRQHPRDDMPGATPCPQYMVWWNKRRESMAIEDQSRRTLGRRMGAAGLEDSSPSKGWQE
jgi:hypothetical protein